MKEQGTGRTRVGRFAALTIPAGVAAAGLGFAMLNGMVSATLSSAQGFGLQSTALKSDGLAVRTGAAEVGTTGNGDSTIYAQTDNTEANGIKVRSASVALPFGLGEFGLQISSADTAIPLDDVTLNAKSLGTDGATLKNVTLGAAQSETAANGFTGFADAASGGTNSGFSLSAKSTTAGLQDNVLNDVSAAAYAISLGSLNLDDLGISLRNGAYTPVSSGVLDTDFN